MIVSRAEFCELQKCCGRGLYCALCFMRWYRKVNEREGASNTAAAGNPGQKRFMVKTRQCRHGQRRGNCGSLD